MEGRSSYGAVNIERNNGDIEQADDYEDEIAFVFLFWFSLPAFSLFSSLW